MSNKKPSKAAMSMAALKKENLRLMRKILTLEAKAVTMQSELLLRPPYSPPRLPDSRLSVRSLDKFFEELDSRGSHAD